MRRFNRLSSSFILAISLGLSGCGGAMLPSALLVPKGAFAPGEVMVQWRADASVSQAQAVISRLGASVLKGAEGSLQLLQVPNGQELSFCERFSKEPPVAYAEPNYETTTMEIRGSFKPFRHVLMVPNDPGFNSPQAPNSSWGLQAIHADKAWDVTAGDPSVLVAIIDTGCDMQHPDLAANLDVQEASNFLQPGTPPDDDYGHGTHVAGIIAAIGNNRIGTLGVAWKCRVLPLRVLGVDGSGNDFDVVSAMDYAIARHARVINLSLGSADRSDIEYQAIKRALSAGIVVVAAAGNEATTGNPLEYPASYPGVVSVGAIGMDLQRAAFSNFNSQVSLVAPGVDILSTLPTRFSGSTPFPYGYMSGTSMAVPMVSGCAALVFSQHPGWNGSQVVATLLRTAQPLTPTGDIPGFNVYFGNGLVNAAQAVAQ
jgi:thermitase